MDFYENFKIMMQKHTEIALATSVNNVPNVRIINFYYNPQKKIIYFSTFKENEKVKEIKLNNNVSLTTIPKEGTAHIRVQNGIVQKSSLSIYDLKKEFIRKIPDYEEIINEAGKFLIVYEICFQKVLVTLNYNASKEITI